MNCVMLFGLGFVGSWALEMLARSPGVEHLIAVDVNESYASRRAKAAMCGASHLGYFPKIEFVPCDVMNIDQTAEMLKKYNPKVILSTMSAITGYPGDRIAKEKEDLIEDAGTGPFLPAQMLLINKLMKAVDQAAIKPLVTNASFNDAVSPLLKTVGVRMPTIGMGNLDNLVPVIRMQIAQKMNVPMQSIKVYLFSHHFNNVWCTRQRPGGMCPYKMKILINGEDVTAQFNTDELMLGTTKAKNRLGGTDGSSLTASSAVKHTLAFLNDMEIFSHAPGVNGNVGGYPFYIKDNKVELTLPFGITLEEAIKVNLEGQYRDGIQEIQKDGTVIFTDEAVSLMKQAINYECKIMKYQDHEAWAKELLTKFRAVWRT